MINVIRRSCINTSSRVPSIFLHRYNSHRSVTDAEELEDILGQYTDKKNSNTPNTETDEEQIRRRSLFRTNKEAIALYRDVIRATRYFVWLNGKGEVWRDVLRNSTRKEFEQSRSETDPEVINRMVVGGRDALQKVIDDMVKKAQENVLEKKRDV